MEELARGFDAAVVSVEARRLYGEILRLAGDRDWEARGAALIDTERQAIVTAFWSLDRVLARDYFTGRADSVSGEPREMAT